MLTSGRRLARGGSPGCRRLSGRRCAGCRRNRAGGPLCFFAGRRGDGSRETHSSDREIQSIRVPICGTPLTSPRQIGHSLARSVRPRSVRLFLRWRGSCRCGLLKPLCQMASLRVDLLGRHTEQREDAFQVIHHCRRAAYQELVAAVLPGQMLREHFAGKVPALAAPVCRRRVENIDHRWIGPLPQLLELFAKAQIAFLRAGVENQQRSGICSVGEGFVGEGRADGKQWGNAHAAANQYVARALGAVGAERSLRAIRPDARAGLEAGSHFARPVAERLDREGEFAGGVTGLRAGLRAGFGGGGHQDGMLFEMKRRLGGIQPGGNGLL